MEKDFNKNYRKLCLNEIKSDYTLEILKIKKLEISQNKLSVKLKSFKCINIILIVCLVSYFLISCATRSNGPEIWATAQDYVESYLPNYSIKTFPANYEDYIVKIGKDKYEIEAYVIEDNTYCCGSYIRTFFSCIIEYKNGKYTAHSLEFGISEKWKKALDWRKQ